MHFSNNSNNSNQHRKQYPHNTTSAIEFKINIDNALRACLVTIINVDSNDNQWRQANLPVKTGNLGAEASPPNTFGIFFLST